MLKPLNDNVVLEKKKDKNTTSSGIILSTKEKEMDGVARVVAVGPGTNDVKMQVKPGDDVIYKKYSTTEIKVSDKDYMILHQSDILAILEEE